MKIFNTIEDLWQYITYCPICKNNDRIVCYSAITADNYLLIKNLKKENEKLCLTLSFKKTKFYLKINCLNNSYNIFNINGLIENNLPEFQIYFYSDCRRCGSYTLSNDISLDISNNLLYDIGVDEDHVRLKNGDDNIYIWSYYDKSKEFKTSIRYRKNGIIGEEIIFPFINLDFTNIDKTIQKIKILTILS